MKSRILRAPTINVWLRTLERHCNGDTLPGYITEGDNGSERDKQ